MKSQHIKRRKFIKVAGIGLGASILTPAASGLKNCHRSGAKSNLSDKMDDTNVMAEVCQ